MFGKRITGVDVLIINTLPAVLEKARELLNCDCDLQDIRSLDISTKKNPGGISIEILNVTVRVTLEYSHQKNVLSASGRVYRYTKPRSKWIGALYWVVTHAGRQVEIDLPVRTAVRQS